MRSSCSAGEWIPAFAQHLRHAIIDAAAVHISYGQRTEERELRAFSAICDRLGIGDRLAVRNPALAAIGGSALTDRNIAVPDSHALGRDIPVTYVPFRNAHFPVRGGKLGRSDWCGQDLYWRGGAG